MATEIRRDEEPQPLNVKLGEPFKVSPNLDQIEHDYMDAILLTPTEINIEGLGTGRVQIKKDKNIIQTPDNFAWEKFPGAREDGWQSITPAGPFNISYEAKDGKLSIDPNTLPLQVKVYIDNLTPEQLQKIKCSLTYKDKLYEGALYYDEVELEEEIVIADFWYWREPGSQDERPVELFFPQNPEIFKDLSITISL